MAESTTAEHLALLLTESGMQRMAARVLCALLYAEQETITAGELGERLAASAGAVSGALKTLVTLNLVERVPAPGSRREHYRLRADGWAAMTGGNNRLIDAMVQSAEEGIAAVGEDSIAGRRLAEMRDFYAYIQREIPALIERWHQQRGVR